MLEAGHKLISATPTWAQIMEQVSWGKELTSANVTEGGDTLGGIAPPGTNISGESIPQNGDYPPYDKEIPEVGPQDGLVLPSSKLGGIGAKNGSKSYSGSPTVVSTSAVSQGTALRFDENGHPPRNIIAAGKVMYNRSLYGFARSLLPL